MNEGGNIRKERGALMVKDLWRVTDRPVLLTKRNVRLFFRYVALYTVVIHVSLGIIAGIRNRLVKNTEYGAILISGQAFTKYDYWASPLAWFGAYPYWTSYFNNRGLKARWVLNAKGLDFEKAIEDEKCVSMVLVGHGSFSLWAATDMDITPDEVSRLMAGRKKKPGEWLQLTCGVDEGLPKIGELVMEKDRVYTYDESINAYYLATDALFGFKYIKSLKHKDLKSAGKE